MTRLRLHRGVVGAAVAAGLGLAAGLVPGHHETPPSYEAAGVMAARSVTPGDRVSAAIEGVRPTGFYVGPELRGVLTAAETSSIERTIATAPVPLFVVWWDDTSDGGYATAYGALDQIRAGVGADGFYAVVTRGRNPIFGALGYEDPFVTADGRGRPGPALTRIVTELAAVTPEPQADTSIAAGTLGRTAASDFDYWGGPGGGIGAGLLLVTGGYLGLLLVVAVVGVLVRGLGRTGGGRA